jgi:DNA-binding response OmpR family regulator
MNLGADDYLTKPVAQADLLKAIEVRLRRFVSHLAMRYASLSQSGLLFLSC